MRNGIYGLFMDAKEFFSNGVNGVTVLLIISIIISCAWNYKIEKEIKALSVKQQSNQVALMNEIESNRKKIHFRYFNLTKSIEDIAGVQIDTKDGSVIRHIKSVKE